jgi:hypothetical protein
VKIYKIKINKKWIIKQRKRGIGGVRNSLRWKVIKKKTNLEEEVMEVGSSQGKILRNNLEEEVMENEYNRRKLNRNSLEEVVMEGRSGWKKSKRLTGEMMEIRSNQEKLNRNSLIEEVTKKKNYLEEEVAEK